MIYKYCPSGVCSRLIEIDYDEKENIINNITFTGGCNGNLKGISSLAKGRRPDEIVAALKGIDCNCKGTSCPDQLARALEKMAENKKQSC